MIKNTLIKKPYNLLLLPAMIFILIACNSLSKKTNAQPVSNVDSNSTVVSSHPFSYDLEHPQKKWQLPNELLEISGNTWIDKDHILVIEDLHPNLYLLNIKEPKVVVEKTIPFQKDESGKKFDIEDVTIANDVVYALWSHGSVYKISDWQGTPQVKQVNTFLGKENNTEGICFDPVTNNILIACKNDDNEEEGKKSTRGVYQFNISGDSLMPDPFMLVEKKDLKTFTGNKENFYPSAIAVHPVTHDIYMLSTKETKCMVVFTHEGVLKDFKLMDKDIFPQPEGICFAPDGTLYISTEGKKGGSGFLYQFQMK